MTGKYSGGCACGAIRYEVGAEPTIGPTAGAATASAGAAPDMPASSPSRNPASA